MTPIGYQILCSSKATEYLVILTSEMSPENKRAGLSDGLLNLPSSKLFLHS